MIDQEVIFIQRATALMVKTFLDELHKDEYKGVLDEHFSCVVKSVVSSFTATMIHKWCETVEGKEDYRKTFVSMLEAVLNNVMLTMDMKENQHINVSREVH